LPSPDGRELGLASFADDMVHMVWLDPASGKTRPWQDIHHERNLRINGVCAAGSAYLYGVARGFDTLFVVTGLS
jgi:hypothetical protein